LTTAKENQAKAVIDVAEAIERETTAMEEYGKAIEAAGKIAGLYPIIAGKFNVANPMSGSANSIPATVTGNSTGYNPNGTVINNTVQAGIVASPDQVAQELANLSDRYRRLNGGTGFF
jgi:hypothetical protein